MNSQMHNRQEQMEQLAIWCCQIVPILLLAWNALAWLRWGTDLPYLDDWHVYTAKIGRASCRERV